MSRVLTIIGVLLLASVGTVSAQTPSPDAIAAARTLVHTLKISDQYKALLPAILIMLGCYYASMTWSVFISMTRSSLLRKTSPLLSLLR